jgi:putative ABC transport system permease protein
VLEINQNRARITAKTDGIVGFITTPYVFTTLESARAYGRMPAGYCSYYLIQAEDGANLEQLCREIRQRVPELDAYTAADFSFKTRMYWIVRTGLGMSFGGSTMLGLTVGLVMVAQSLYAFVLDHQSDYATLKAIGAEDAQVYQILLLQSVTIAVMGAIIGNAMSFLIRHFFSTPRLTIDMPPLLLLISTSLAIAICLLSSFLPFHRIRLVDPITVLQE